MNHNVFSNCGSERKGFVVFNDQEMSAEPILEGDLEGCWIPDAPNPARSAAWSCDVDFYFIVRHSDILLFNVHSNRGLRCRKKSYKFIELFVDFTPLPKRKRG